MLVLEYIYVPIIVSSLAFLHWFYTYFAWSYLVLISEVFKIILGVFEDFEVK